LEAAAAGYAGANARGGRADATVCGNATDVTPCPDPSGALTDCVGSRPATGEYLEVRANTRLPDGSTALPPIFAEAVIDDYDAPNVTACARVAWGPPTTARGLGMTVSICDWKKLTADGGSYPATDEVLALFDDRNPAACGVAGTDATNAGGFRWLDAVDGGCAAVATAGTSYRVDEDADTSPGCIDALSELHDSGRPVAVPVFGAPVGGPGPPTYTVTGWAAFVVTGWTLPGSIVPSPTLTSCGATVTYCVYGHFSRAVVPGGGRTGGPDLGAHIVALTG
jgi:hypothetical protein